MIYIMSAVLPSQTKNIETNIRNYLTHSYTMGYDLDMYFTAPQQVKMFERLLSCDTDFKQQWESGVYSVPEDPKSTMYLSSYIKKQSAIKKYSRKIRKHTSKQKLTQGAKNVLEAYMREQSQESMNEGAERNIDARMEKMFCGIFTQIRDRKKNDLSKKVPDVLADEIIGFVDNKKKKTGGTRKKRHSR